MDSRAIAGAGVTVEEFAEAMERLSDSAAAAVTGGIVVNVVTPGDLELQHYRRRAAESLRNWRWERRLLWFALAVGAGFAWFATFGRFWWLYWAAWQVYTYQRWRDERRAFAELADPLPAARLLRGERRGA